MKLSRMVRFGFAAATIAALVLLPSSSAADHDHAASSSGAQPDSAATLVVSERPRPSVHRYKNLLDIRRIDALPSRTLLQPHIHDYFNVPFYSGSPLFLTKEDPSVVEQALKDYGSVGIVDLARRQAMQIIYGEGRLENKMFPNTRLPIRLFEVDPNVHLLHKNVLGWRARLPPAQSTDHLPHLDGKPILTPPADSLSYMLYATHHRPGSFYHVRPDHEPMLVDPHNADLYTTPVGQERRKLDQVLTHHQVATRKYGRSFASVLWGKPLFLPQRFQDTRKERIPLTDYPRFLPVASRETMVNALERKGRFRLYVNDHRGRNVYKIKVNNLDAGIDEPMDISVKPLTKMERLQEWAMAAAGKFHLPA